APPTEAADEPAARAPAHSPCPAAGGGPRAAGAQPRSARHALAVAARLPDLLGDRHLRGGRLPLLPAAAPDRVRSGRRRRRSRSGGRGRGEVDAAPGRGLGGCAGAGAFGAGRAPHQPRRRDRARARDDRARRQAPAPGAPRASPAVHRARGTRRRRARERQSAGVHPHGLPPGRRITVAQVMWLYRWRGALQLAEKGYDLWRILRLLNPVSAATQELRETFTRQIIEAGREHLGRRLARAFVKEVGRAAIDLY